MHERCEIPRCRAVAELTYLGRGICSRHWMQLTNEKTPPDALRMALGLPAAHEPEMEDTMSSKKKTPQTPEQLPAETPQDKADAAAPPTAKETKPVKAKAPKAEKATKPEKPPRPPKEKGLVVFAFRLTAEERDAIHKAAGPARASRFVRAVAVAAAQDDEAALRETLRQARKGRT